MVKKPAPLFLVLVLVAAAAAADFLFTGIWTIRQDEQGVVLRFGGMNRKLTPGIHFTFPWPVETVEKVNTSETRKMPVGFRFVPGRDPVSSGSDETEWLTGDTNVIDIRMMIHYVIADPVDYLFRVGPGEADFLIRKCAESVLTEVIATMQVDDVFTIGKVRIQEEIKNGAQAVLDRLDSGVTILSANLQEITPPSEVIEAFNDVSRAKADKERSRQEADGYVKDKLPKARAEANKIRQDARIYESTVINGAKGRAERFRALCTEYHLAEEITRTRFLLGSLERILSGTDMVVVPVDDEGKAGIRLVR